MLKRLSLILIKTYQMVISPLMPKVCRFYPSCSEYAVEAFSTLNTLKAGWLTLKRIFRCNPFCEGGYDPLPNNQENRKI